MTETAPAVPAAAPVVPGRTLGIVALILSIVVSWLPLVGLIMGIVARNQSKKAGVGNVPAVIAIVLSILALIGVIIFIAFFALAAATGNVTVTTTP